jgi:hypothetical protein
MELLKKSRTQENEFLMSCRPPFMKIGPAYRAIPVIFLNNMYWCKSIFAYSGYIFFCH